MNILTDLGYKPFEGVLVAYLPPMDAVLQEHYREYMAWNGRKAQQTMYSIDGVVVDLLDTERKDVRWWVVKNAARDVGMGPVEPIWQGSAADFAQMWPDNLPQVPRPEGAKLHVRGFSRGPWVALEKEPVCLEKEGKNEG